MFIIELGVCTRIMHERIIRQDPSILMKLGIN